MKNKIEEGAAWTKKAGKNPEGGLNQKGVDSYKKENPGSKLKTAVTTKPSKLKKGSKSANRRKSFCARMSGMRKRQKDSNNTGKDRLSLSLKKWNCSTEIVRDARIALAEACWKGYTAYGMKMKNGKQVPNCVPTKASKKKKAIKEAIFSLYEVRENRFRDAGRKTGEFFKRVKDAASREGGYLKGAADQVKANARTGGQMIRKAVDKIPGTNFDQVKSNIKSAVRRGRDAIKNIPQTSVRGRSGPDGKPEVYKDPEGRVYRSKGGGVETTPGRLSKLKSRLPSFEDIKSKGRDLIRKGSDPIQRSTTKFPTAAAAEPAAAPAPAAPAAPAKPAATAAAAPAPAKPAAKPAATAAAAPAPAKPAAKPAATAYGTSRRAVNRARNKAAKPKTPDLEQPNLSVMDNFRRAVRDPSKNQQIDNWNAGKSEDKPEGAVQKGTPGGATGSPRFEGRSDAKAPRGRRASDDQLERRGREVPTTTLAGGGNTARAKSANRKRRDTSTEIVKNGRMALAEKVLEALSPDETKADPKTRKKRMKKGAKAVKSRADKVINKANHSTEPTFKDNVRARVKKSKKPDGVITAISKEKVAQDDKKVKKAQGKNTPSSVFGKAGTKTSTDSYGGNAGSEENKVNRATPDQINRSRSDNPGEVFKRAGKKTPKEPAAFGTSKRAVNRANRKAVKKKVSNYADEVESDLTPRDY